jgi:hypothetical protein
MLLLVEIDIGLLPCLINSVEMHLSWEAASYAATEEFPNIL